MNTDKPGSEWWRERLAKAQDLQARGELDDAEALVREVLEMDPCQVDALNLLGYVYQARNDPDAAETMMMRAVAFEPNHPPNYASLGDFYRWLGQSDLAILSYQNGLGVDESHLSCLRGLFLALQQSNRSKQANEVGHRLIELTPNDFDILNDVGALNLQHGRFGVAIDLLKRALAVKEDLTTREMLGRSYSLTGDSENAYRQYERILEIDPDHPIASHHLAANSDNPEDIPQRAADDYVRHAFNDFAESFDKTLGDLRYQAPRIIHHLLQERLDAPGQQYDVVDLGCGTGLCGVEIAPFCRRLVGVDLSDEMLKIASETQVYTELACAELVGFLHDQPKDFDLAVSSDSLIYLGDQGPVFSATIDRLVPGGWLIATFEVLDQTSGKPYKLTRSGRYAHSRRYLERSLAQAGFEEIEIMEVHLRVEAGVPVEGFAIAARAPTDTP